MTTANTAGNGINKLQSCEVVNTQKPNGVNNVPSSQFLIYSEQNFRIKEIEDGLFIL